MNFKEVYIFIGPPGAGKGSISQLCIQELGWKQFSTGALCRKHIAEATGIGKQIDFAIKSGKLIADNLIIEMVEDWMLSNMTQLQAVILDGFPRTVAQAQALTTLLHDKFPDCSLRIVKFSLSDEHIIQRLAGRSVCQNKDCQAVYSLHPGSHLAPKRPMLCDICSNPLMRRLDDEVSSVVERIATYHHHEQDLINFYTTQGHTIYDVNVERPLNAVFDDLKELARSKVV